MTRRRFLKLALGAVGSAGLTALAGAGYARFVEPSWPKLEQISLPVAGLPHHLDGFTMIQLSDLHRGPDVTEADLADAAGRAADLAADVAVLTGDYVSGSAEYVPSCAQAISTLATAHQTIACLGNHDHWTDAERVSGALRDAGITVLRNAAREVADGLWIAAVDDVWEKYADLDETLEAVPAGATVVLLAHEPDSADQIATDGRVAAQLSGHSHGGQIDLPLIGPPVLPHLGQKYPAGRYKVHNMWLYVNRGIGLIAPPVRLNCRPEVTHLTLRAT